MAAANASGNSCRGAFIESCNELEEAIRSLDTLNKRIDSFRTSDIWLSSPVAKQTLSTNVAVVQPLASVPTTSTLESSGENTSQHFKNKTQTSSGTSTIESSVVLIQNLLVDTQRQCTKMVDDNYSLAARLDGELGRCQDQVDTLRKELAYAHRCVSDLEVNMMINGSATESDTEGQNADQDNAEVEIYRLREENSRLSTQLRATRQEVVSLKMRRQQCNDDDGECGCQQRQMNGGDKNGNCIASVDGASLLHQHHLNETSKGENLKLTLNSIQAELMQAKEALLVLKNDRKRLKSEKLELLNQMKDVYQTLESKERELRDFIRQFEQKMRDSDKGIKELILEKEKSEKERQKLEEALTRAEEKANQVKIDSEKDKDENLRLKAQLKELQGRFVLLTGQPISTTVSSSTTQIPTPSVGYCSISTTSPAFILQGDRHDEGHVHHEQSSSTSGERSFDQASKLVGPPRKPRTLRKESMSQDRNSNRLSKLFNLRRSKSKDETSIVLAMDEPAEADDPISADLCLAEKADQLIQARKLPFARWRQSHILAWLELELGLVQYTKIFTDNVKSGRVLMSLSDNEIEHSLGISNSMHKKKLRLAIEEYRAPSLCKFPCIKEVTNNYLCASFIPAIGLEQYGETFRVNSIDGRILNYLNKKQLEKYLNINKRSHQISILKGIELLRLFNYDIKTLNKRRIECERDTSDLLVWTNARMMKWLQQIDLEEYADNLRESGVHGALAVLDHAFTNDSLATALCIPNAKQMVRKHLADEFEPLQHQARVRLCNAQSAAKEIHNSSPKRSGSLGRTFVRSYTVTGDQGFDQANKSAALNKKRTGIRSSIGRVFGIKSRRDSEEYGDISPVRNSDQVKDLCKNSSSKALNQSTGTISSTTSDLGSSIERSQHMKTILATPQVLIQPPMTALGDVRRNGNNVSVEKLSTGVMTEPSRSVTDLSRLQHLCLSPGEAVGSVKGSFVRMRQKKSVQVRSPGANPTRPHSIGDFSQKPNGVAKQQFLSSIASKSGVYFSPQRLHNWLSLDHVDPKVSAAQPINDTVTQSEDQHDRHMGTIVEQGEFELETDIMEYKSVGGTQVVWQNGRKKEPLSVKCSSEESPTYQNRPRSLPLKQANVAVDSPSKPSLNSLDVVHETDL